MSDATTGGGPVENIELSEQVIAANPPGFFTSRDTRAERVDVCRGCDRLFTPTFTCKECGCFMGLKTWLGDATCPLGKW